MSLPSGYKRLEYIQSSGTQYIDTGLFVTRRNYNKLKIVADSIVGTAANGWAVSGSGNGVSVYYGCGNNSRMIYYGNGTQDLSSGYTYDNARRTWTLDMMNGKYSVSGLFDIDISVNAPSASNGIYIFAYSEYGTNNAVKHNETIYGYKLYNNGVLVCDLIPCKNASNDVGLWDDVNSAFRANAGTGVFIAGPEVPDAPPTPTDFGGTWDGTLARLSWAASDGADGYKVYRNGVKIADISATSYTDAAEPFTTTAYGVSAYNDDGESEQAQTTVPAFPDNPILYLITDRSQRDLNRAKYLCDKGWENLTEEEKDECRNILKGLYTNTDFNRVEKAVEFLRDYLNNLQPVLDIYRELYGVASDELFSVTWDYLDFICKTDWKKEDIQSKEQLEEYLQHIYTVTSCISIARTLPSSMTKLTIDGANEIEKSIISEYNAGLNFEEKKKTLIEKTAAAWFFSGDLYGGEI